MLAVSLIKWSVPVRNVQQHKCDLFSVCIFFIKYGSLFKHWRIEVLILGYAQVRLVKLGAPLG